MRASCERTLHHRKAIMPRACEVNGGMLPRDLAFDREPAAANVPLCRDQSLVDARDRSFQSAPCFCQFIRMWRLVELFLPSATASLSPTQWKRTIAASPTTRTLGSS